MIAGRMRYRLRVERPEIVIDEYHAESTRWVEVGVIWAERVKNTGYRHDEVGEHFSDHRAEYNVRIQHDVRANWRIEEVGGLRYTVTATIPNRERGMLTLVCERLNE